MSSAPQRADAFAYRPDIDGLRALAVLAVIFYHAGVPGFGGGYVGVDVFFVISGYLITQFLRSTSVRGARQILGNFYARRVRRILPALEVADPRLAFTAAMRHTVQVLRDAGGGAVCVVFDVPQLKYPGTHALLIAHRRGIPDDFLALTRADALAPVQQMEGDVRALA